MSWVRWSDEDWQKAKSLLETEDRAIVARAVGRSLACLKEKIRWESMSEKDRQLRREQINARRRADKARGITRERYEKLPPAILIDGRPRISQQALDDRTARSILRPRDVTAALCGDPLPGWSALERRT